MKVVFLDIDGVLNKNSTKEMFGCYTGIDESLVQNFKRILTETGAKVVLSSTWRLAADTRQHVYDRIGQEHFIGETISLGRYNARPSEVEEWILNPHNPEVDRFCVLDDDHMFFPEQKHFRTTWVDGLSKKISQQVIDYLNDVDTDL